MVRASLVFPVLLTVILLSPAARAADGAADGGDEKGLTIVLDHAKLTAWVLEEFPDGLPFDRTGRPTDAKQAQKFWQLIADWPISLNGPVTELLPAINAISQEAGLPIEFGMDASKRLSNADSKMKMFTINDSVQKTIRIICRSAGVDKTVVTPGGLLVLGPDDPEEPEEVVAATPTNTFRWRADYKKLVEKALGEDWDPQAATDDDHKQLMKIAASIRCDLLVPGEMALEQFLQWLAAASQQSFAVDQAVADLVGRPISTDPRFLGPPVRVDDEEKGIKIGPAECRFALFLDALNAALAPAGLEATAEEARFSITLKEELEKPKEE